MKHLVIHGKNLDEVYYVRDIFYNHKKVKKEPDIAMRKTKDCLRFQVIIDIED